jgi:hypothetical protein
LARLACDISVELAALLIACLIVVALVGLVTVLTSFQTFVGAIDIPAGVYAGDVKKINKKKERYITCRVRDLPCSFAFDVGRRITLLGTAKPVFARSWRATPFTRGFFSFLLVPPRGS